MKFYARSAAIPHKGKLKTIFAGLIADVICLLSENLCEQLFQGKKNWKKKNNKRSKCNKASQRTEQAKTTFENSLAQVCNLLIIQLPNYTCGPCQTPKCHKSYNLSIFAFCRVHIYQGNSVIDLSFSFAPTVCNSQLVSSIF